MTMNGIRLKSGIKNLLDLSKRKFGLNNLNIKEIDGNIGGFTKIKLMPHTSVRVPFSLGRTIRGVSFLDSNEKDPFASFVRRCSLGESEAGLVNYLFALYKQESYKSSAEIVGLPNNLILSEYPAWALVMPWEKRTLQEKYRGYFKAFIENRADNGTKFTESQLLSVNDAFYSGSNALSQVLQTRALSRSIQLKGLLEFKPLPGIYIMYDGRRWRWFVSGDGNHRAYLANILGHESFLVHVKGVINRLDVNKWENVINGTYSRVDALKLFDSFFNGDKTRRGIV